MFKICIITYYGLKDVLKIVADAFEYWGYTVIDFPLYRYAFDSHDKTDSYVEMMIDFLKLHKPTAILWWCHNTISIKDFELVNDYIRESNIVNMIYNWDDPYCWTVMDIHMQTKSKYFNLVFSGCGQNEEYKHGSFFYLAPPFDPNIHKPLPVSSSYECDVSIVIHNTYASSQVYPNQLINRRIAMLAIAQSAKKHGFKFHVYGPNFLQHEFPEHYKGLASYPELAMIFSNSKINISTHVDGTRDFYMNERCVLVGACKGLLLVDAPKNKKFPLSSESYVAWDVRDPCGHILDILKNYSSYQSVKESIYKECLEKYTNVQFALHIHTQLAAFLIQNPTDYVYYNGLVDAQQVLQSVENCRAHFITFGCKEGLVPGPLATIPVTFSLESYIKKNSDRNVKQWKTRDAAFGHWCMIGKHVGFKSGSDVALLKTKRNVLADPPKPGSIPIPKDISLFFVMNTIHEKNLGLAEFIKTIQDFGTQANYHLYDPNAYTEYIQSTKNKNEFFPLDPIDPATRDAAAFSNGKTLNQYFKDFFEKEG